MKAVELTSLIEAGAHFGHLTRRWNPKMKKYIFMEKNGIHIIDLKKTKTQIEKAATAMNEIVAKGEKVLFVGTKKQAKSVVAASAKKCEMHWVTERWLGGMLTNYSTIRKSIKRLQAIDKMESDGTFNKITKKERLTHTREKNKLRKVLDGIETMGRLPGALFIVDIKKESIAVKEAQRLNIPTFAIVDTNCDPNEVDYVIPANDDAAKTIELISSIMADAIAEGNVKAQELKAHEDAERERQRKENLEKGGEEGKVRVRTFRSDGQRPNRKRVRRQETSSTEKQAETEIAKTETTETTKAKEVDNTKTVEKTEKVKQEVENKETENKE